MEKTKAVSKRKEKRALVFTGATELMGVDPKKMTQADVVAHKLRVLVAKAVAISPLHVTILGNQPYIDNRGRKEKLATYAPGAQFEYDYVQIAKDDDEKAIVRARLVNAKGKALCGWVIGECSTKTMGMSTLKGYQNHMAQTRAENRAFEAAFGQKLRNDLFAGVARELGAGNMDSEIAEKALNAGNTSAEEAVSMKKQPVVDVDPYVNAYNAIQRVQSKAAAQALIPRVKESKNLEPAAKSELLRMIDERIKALQ